MPHVDEGTLHALLDGELEPTEVQQVQTHFATCPTCAARLDEARQILAETERLLKAIESPMEDRPADDRSPAAHSEPRVATPPDTWSFDSGSSSIPGDPVVYVPDNPAPVDIRRQRNRLIAWAAGIAVVVGAGGWGVKAALAPAPGPGELRLRPEEFQSAPGAAAAAGALADSASPTERAAAVLDSMRALAMAEGADSAAPANANAAAAKTAAKTPAPQPKSAAPAETPPPQKQLAAAPTPKAPAKDAAPETKAPATEPKPAAAESAASAGNTSGDTSTSAASPDDSTNEPAAGAAAGDPNAGDSAAGVRAVRDRAAEATRALDRQRAEEQSARALAAIDAERKAAAERARRDSIAVASRAAAARAPAPAPVPAAPTIDQRAQVYDRIGLDEAARLLGGPLHAIDAVGVTRRLVGLAPGKSVPGADPDRPVVRAVYQDPSGHLLYLDQQRVSAAEASRLPASPEAGPGGSQRWVTGSVLLQLHGDATSDWLSTLAREVR